MEEKARRWSGSNRSDLFSGRWPVVAQDGAMLNFIWLALVLGAVLIGGFHGRSSEVANGGIKGAETAVTLAIGLVGVMALWLGVMRLAEKSGLIHGIARALSPLLRWLFPEVPPDHPAMGSMVMNMAANMLGLVNAATPLGLRAMRDLERLNPHPGAATNAMCTFLAINTSSIQLIPITAIALMTAAGSRNPSAIVGTALLATTCSTIAGIFTVKALEKLPFFRVVPRTGDASTAHGPAQLRRADADGPVACLFCLVLFPARFPDAASRGGALDFGD
jgi:spore maturation protein A